MSTGSFDSESVKFHITKLNLKKCLLCNRITKKYVSCLVLYLVYLICHQHENEKKGCSNEKGLFINSLMRQKENKNKDREK